MLGTGARAARLLGVAVRNPRALAGRFRYVFILSHMRAYTSLLAHILGSHPEISGYFELHQDYRGDLDLLRMRVGVAIGLSHRLRGRYVLDKILHSRHRIDGRILARENVFTIFLVRRPLDTLRSLAQGPRFASNPDGAAPYYVERLQSLAAAAGVPRNRVYLDAEALLERPEATLGFLRSYLGLGEPLRPTYRTFRFTGRPGYGDASELITRGVIVRDRGGPEEGGADPAGLREAEAAFGEARRALMRTCRTLGQGAAR